MDGVLEQLVLGTSGSDTSDSRTLSVSLGVEGERKNCPSLRCPAMSVESVSAIYTRGRQRLTIVIGRGFVIGMRKKGDHIRCIIIFMYKFTVECWRKEGNGVAEIWELSRQVWTTIPPIAHTCIHACTWFLLQNFEKPSCSTIAAGSMLMFRRNMSG